MSENFYAFLMSNVKEKDLSKAEKKIAKYYDKGINKSQMIEFLLSFWSSSVLETVVIESNKKRLNCE
tara:strand:+ start:49 stop:249 length:201 start_codon:yes stop_codon:yes gene_type:complete